MKIKHITIINDMVRELVRMGYASAEDVQQELGCSNRTAYRIIRAHKAASVKDPDKRKPYSVMTRADLLDIKLGYVPQRGNPRMKERGYQRALAERRHREKAPEE